MVIMTGIKTRVNKLIIYTWKAIRKQSGGFSTGFLKFPFVSEWFYEEKALG